MVVTFDEILSRHRVAIPAHLEAQAEVPVLGDLQAQGDVIVVPTRPPAKPGAPIPPEGVPVVRGEAGGNTHLLVGDGCWQPRSDALDLGVVTVPPGGAAFLLHPEHGANGLAPGAFVLRRQREQADEIRRVAD